MINKHESPETLAMISNAPVDVCRLLFVIGETGEGFAGEGVQLIRSNARGLDVCEMRHAVSWVSREYLGATFSQIGRALNRDHSSVVRSYRRATILRHIDEDFRAILNDLISRSNIRTVRRTASRRPLRSIKPCR